MNPKIKTDSKLIKMLEDHQYWVWLMLALVFFFGLVGRFYDFDDPPLDFHPTRQLHSMLIARGMYYENLVDAPEEQRALAVQQWKSEGQIEPPIMERLTAWGYRLVGTDDLRVPRFLSIFFWTAGGIGLFLLLSDVVGAKGAVIGLAYYMVLPFPLYASRSFQPEPLMTAAIIFSWWAIERWAKQNTWVNAVVAGLLSGLVIYVKLPADYHGDFGCCTCISLSCGWDLSIRLSTKPDRFQVVSSIVNGSLSLLKVEKCD